MASKNLKYMQKTFVGKHSELTGKIIKVFYEVYNNLGYGFLEKIYEKVMFIELSKLGFKCQAQKPIKVFYDGAIIGDYFADLVVDDLILIELKTADKMSNEHIAQLLNYLKATRYEVGLLFNFGPDPELDREVFDNERKGSLSWIANHSK